MFKRLVKRLVNRLNTKFNGENLSKNHLLTLRFICALNKFFPHTHVPFECAGSAIVAALTIAASM